MHQYDSGVPNLKQNIFDITGKRVWVAGHSGLVGSALLRRLERENVGDIVTASSIEVDLTRQTDTEHFIARTRPEVVFLAAARVGGIFANSSSQASFLYDNLMIAANAIESCRRYGTEKFVMLGSSCIYPREAQQPIAEEALMTGPLEPTNEGYAVAKIASLELAKMYRRQHGFDAISLMPTNLYGPNDNFDLRTGHVLPSLLRKIHEAKVNASPTVELWGTGKALREFLHADDLADAALLALERYSEEQHLNVGSKEEVSIAALGRIIAEVVQWKGHFEFNEKYPDGTPRKVLDSSKLTALGWRPKITLRDGVASAYRWMVGSGLVSRTY